MQMSLPQFILANINMSWMNSLQVLDWRTSWVALRMKARTLILPSFILSRCTYIANHLLNSTQYWIISRPMMKLTFGWRQSMHARYSAIACSTL